MSGCFCSKKLNHIKYSFITAFIDLPRQIYYIKPCIVNSHWQVGGDSSVAASLLSVGCRRPDKSRQKISRTVRYIPTTHSSDTSKIQAQATVYRLCFELDSYLLRIDNRSCTEVEQTLTSLQTGKYWSTVVQQWLLASAAPKTIRSRYEQCRDLRYLLRPFFKKQFGYAPTKLLPKRDAEAGTL